MAKPYYRWPKGLRTRILQRDGGTCQIRLPDCTHTATVIDHIIPTLQGGAWFDPSNLRAACQTCNQTRRRTTTPTQPKPQQEHW